MTAPNCFPARQGREEAARSQFAHQQCTDETLEMDSTAPLRGRKL